MSHEESTAQPAGIPERIGDTSTDHAADAGTDGTANRTVEGTAEGLESGPESGATPSVLDAPGVPDTAKAASGPTQAMTSGSGAAPAAGQEAVPEESHAGLADSVGESEDAAMTSTPPEPSGEPGANGGLSTEADPVTELAEELGLAPGATDALDPGQDNGRS